MEGIDNIIYMLDEMLDTPRKRHITGGNTIEYFCFIWRISNNGNVYW